jgi:hypothetical protein
LDDDTRIGRNATTAVTRPETEEAPDSRVPAPREGILLTRFIVSDDVERSRRFYTDVLGGEAVRDRGPAMVALANGWIIINDGGGRTEDKPTVTLGTPSDPDRVSSFLSTRVADIHGIYANWSERGAIRFLPCPRWIEQEAFLSGSCNS